MNTGRHCVQIRYQNKMHREVPLLWETLACTSQQLGWDSHLYRALLLAKHSASHTCPYLLPELAASQNWQIGQHRECRLHGQNNELGHAWLVDSVQRLCKSAARHWHRVMCNDTLCRAHLHVVEIISDLPFEHASWIFFGKVYRCRYTMPCICRWHGVDLVFVRTFLFPWKSTL